MKLNPSFWNVLFESSSSNIQLHFYCKITVRNFASTFEFYLRKSKVNTCKALRSFWSRLWRFSTRFVRLSIRSLWRACPFSTKLRFRSFFFRVSYCFAWSNILLFICSILCAGEGWRFTHSLCWVDDRFRFTHSIVGMLKVVGGIFWAEFVPGWKLGDAFSFLIQCSICCSALSNMRSLFA